MSNPMDEYITDALRKQEAVHLMLAGANLVAQGGVEGIQFAAEVQPELILTVIQELVKCVHEYQTEMNFLIERLAGIYDIVEDTPAEK